VCAENLSIVSSLLTLPCIMNIKLTFENFYHAERAVAARVGFVALGIVAFAVLCGCGCEREKERERARERERACVCVCVQEREGGREREKENMKVLLHLAL